MASPRLTRIRGARMHNLQGIDCVIPRGRITVVTGVSGSGKSTLAFDVLYAEGQRRFVECLSAYARQFMERLERPDVEEVSEIQPPIALKQRVSIKNARSTVGSITELSDYLQLLFTHASVRRCLTCGGAVVRTGAEEALAAIRDWPEGTRLAIVAPLETDPDARELARLRERGFARLLREGALVEIDDLLGAATPAPQRPAARGPAGASRRPAEAGIVVDRVTVGRTRRGRLVEALEAAWKEGRGTCRLQPLGGGAPRILAAGIACSACGARAPELRPALFSPNSPLGACPACHGFGRVTTVDRDKAVPDRRKNLRNHAVVPFSVPSARAWYRKLLREAEARAIPTDVPFANLTPAQQDWVFRGDRGFAGVEGFFRRRERKRYKMHVRIFIARFRGYEPCPACRGTRLRPEALAATIAGRDIDALHRLPLAELRPWLEGVSLSAEQRARVQPLLESIALRMRCLEDVGVGYLTLARTGRTLSGGETQRIRIAAALGNSLTDTLFVLDEPTVGLHATDTAGMLRVLRRMAETGNTLVVVEHDPAVIEAADHLIVLGPGGGRQGGRLVYEGPPGEFLRAEPGFFVATGAAALAPSARPPVARSIPGERRHAARRGARPALREPWSPEAVHAWRARQAPSRASRAGGGSGDVPLLRIENAREHNLRIASLALPLSGLTAISGVSGSGKSTLLDEIIHRHWLRSSGQPVEGVGAVDRVEGFEGLSAVHLVGQDLLGRSSRSNPLSFVQAYGEIRALLAGTIAARQRKLTAGAFSFNTPGGRCETCRGMGVQTLEMYFLPDVEVPCEACAGRRFRDEVLAVTWRGRNIDEILGLTVDEASAFFATEPKVVARLGPLRQVGLGYITLGQSTATLSGGEAQRLKLAAFLAASRERERHLFLFDEPTTGLHARDIGRLLQALRALTGQGHAVIAVEHHLDFIRAADWVVDLGPGAGEAGGEVVFTGPPDHLVEHPASLTASALRDHLARVAAWAAPD